MQNDVHSQAEETGKTVISSPKHRFIIKYGTSAKTRCSQVVSSRFFGIFFKYPGLLFIDSAMP